MAMKPLTESQLKHYAESARRGYADQESVGIYEFHNVWGDGWNICITDSSASSPAGYMYKD